MHIHIVEFDGAFINVHGPSTRDIGLEGQCQERDVIDEEEELVSLHDVTQGQLPIQFVILQFEREQSRVAQFFPTKLYKNMRNQRMHFAVKASEKQKARR